MVKLSKRDHILDNSTTRAISNSSPSPLSFLPQRNHPKYFVYTALCPIISFLSPLGPMSSSSSFSPLTGHKQDLRDHTVVVVVVFVSPSSSVSLAPPRCRQERPAIFCESSSIDDTADLRIFRTRVDERSYYNHNVRPPFPAQSAVWRAVPCH